MPVWKKYKFVIFYLTWRRTNSFQGDWFNLRRFIILIRAFSNLGTVGYMVYLYFNNYKINIVLLMSLEGAYSSKLGIEYKHDLETYIKISGIKSRSRLMIITAPRTNARMYQYQSTMYTFSFMTFNIRTHKASCLCWVPE